MFSRSKVSFWVDSLPGGPPNLVRLFVSQTSSDNVNLNFFFGGVQSFVLEGRIGGFSFRKTLILVRLIVSFSFSSWAVQNFQFGGHFGGS